MAQSAVHVDAYPAQQPGVLGNGLVEERVQVLARAFETQHPGLVVDPGREVGDLAEGHTDQLGQVVNRPVHGMAQADGAQFGCHPVQVQQVHRHRVGVVQQPRVGAEFGDVGGERTQHGEGAQGSEDAADAEGVADGLAQSVAGGDLEVGAGGRRHADLDGVDDEVGAVERRAPLEMCADRRGRTP